MNSAYIVKQNIYNAHLWKGKSALLGRLDIELTERCNNNCIHCYINLPADDSQAKKKELSTDKIKDILKQATSLGCLSVRFTGGEPLLRQDFEELYIFARRQGLKVMLFTNATLITLYLAKVFSRIPPLEKIEVGFYGMKKDSYETATRTSGSFMAARRGINLLLEYNIPFVIKNALLPNNKDEVEEFDVWAKGFSQTDRPARYAMFFNLRARRDDLKKNKIIENLRISPQAGVRFLSKNNGEYHKEMQRFCAKFMHPSGDKLFSCGAGIGGGCVDAYGFLQPCMLLRHPQCIYDLKKGTLKEALIDFFPNLREEKMAANPDYLARCARCFLKGLCEQCPGKSWMEHGTLDTPVEYLCEVAHAQARYLGLLKENELAWEVKDWRERIEGLTREPGRPIEGGIDGYGC